MFKFASVIVVWLKICWDNDFMLQYVFLRLALFGIVSLLSCEPDFFEIFSLHNSMELSELEEFNC